MKIGIVGCGHVGSASAYACVLRGVGTELILMDKNFDLAHAQAEDILHATPFGFPIPVRAGHYEDLEGSAIVIVAAGVNQKPGETRIDLLKRNAEVFSEIIPRIQKYAPEAILLNATNPVDIMTHLAAQFMSGRQGKIIGSGTILDTARFRTLLGQHLGVSSHSVHAYVLGEHGDSEVLHWSGVTVGNTPLANFSAQVSSPITHAIREEIDIGVRRAAYQIIKGKGATWYGIGGGMARIAQAILDDENVVLTCSMPLAEVEGIKDVTLSLPNIIGANGIRQTIYPDLNADEKMQLRRSTEILKELQEKLRL